MTSFTLADWDSRLYSQMSEALARAPLSSWMDPQWPPGYFKQGHFQEHPAPSLWPAALLGYAGLRGDVAAAGADLLFMLLVAWLLGILGRDAWGAAAGHAASVGWLWSFVFIQFLWRARQEPALAVGVLVAVLATQRLERHRAWGILLVAGVGWCAAFKGPYGALVLPVCAAWWRTPSAKRVGDTVTLAGTEARPTRVMGWMGASIIVVGGATGAYEALYQHTTGGSFLRAYWDIQWGYTREQQADWGRLILGAPYLCLAVLVWTLPLSPLLLARLARWRAAPLDPALRATLWGLCSYVGFFAIFNRSASRHVFCAYALWTLGCASVIPGTGVKSWLERHGDRLVGVALASIPAGAAVRAMVGGGGRWLTWVAYFSQ